MSVPDTTHIPLLSSIYVPYNDTGAYPGSSSDLILMYL